MTRLLDLLVPASALRWGRLTKVWYWEALHGVDPIMIPPGVRFRCIGDPNCLECGPWFIYSSDVPSWPDEWPDPSGPTIWERP